MGNEGGKVLGRCVAQKLMERINTAGQ
jgi:hypothetical protein